MVNLKNFLTDQQHIGIPSIDLDKTTDFYQRLGFSIIGKFLNGSNRCYFLQLGHLVIETWEGDETVQKVGAINHISLDTGNVDNAFQAAKDEHFELLDDSIQEIPSFWDNGIRFFNILGPNKETIEVCQIN